MNLIVKFYDVEHGSCTHVITPNGKHLLFDIGSKSDKSICQYLKNKYFYYYGNRPDVLVISHPHIDHISDLENMYTYSIKPNYLWRDKRAFPIQILSSDQPAIKNIKKRANEMSEEYSSSISWETDPENADNNGGVIFTRFTPDIYQSDYGDANNFSCVTVVEYCGFKIILTGDNPAKKLLEMLKTTSYFAGTVANATILLAPHHGRDNEFCSEFVSIVNPRVTVFSDKPIVHETQAHSAQKYGNATRGVTWNGQHRKVFTTRNDGTITFGFRGYQDWTIDTSMIEY